MHFKFEAKKIYEKKLAFSNDYSKIDPSHREHEVRGSRAEFFTIKIYWEGNMTVIGKNVSKIKYQNTSSNH